MAKARKAGVEVYGIGLITNEPQQFYGVKNFLYVGSVDSIGLSFVKQLVKVVSGGRVKVG